MNRLIWGCDGYQLRIAEIDGGSLRNAIPRESFAVITATPNYLQEFERRALEIKAEFALSDEGLEINITPTEMPAKVVCGADVQRITATLRAVHNGVYRMSMAIPGLVETSSSLARVVVKDGQFMTQSLQRSSVDSSKMDIAQTVGSVFLLMGCNVQHDGSYPGWAPDPKSEILEIMVDKYRKTFDAEPRVQACHAGLECGIFAEKYPGVDMISFGPTIRNPHSPDEKVKIDTVQKFWGFLVDILKDTPARN
jgi:dipeptidase D